jgi:hypothetical protein
LRARTHAECVVAFLSPTLASFALFAPLRSPRRSVPRLQNIRFK